MKTFENWYTSILEEVATPAPTKSLAGDVDTIINSLGTLVKELTEELNGPEFNELNEADAEGPSKVMQWIWWMPKARKAQQKVNKIKLNVTDMEAAAEDAPNADQTKKITAKAKIARDQAGELQKMVDDKFASKGELTKRVLHSEKIAGQIASIKRATGLEDNPEKVASYKEKMAELQKKYKEDQEALKELEPSEKDKQDEKDRLEKEAADKKAAADKAIADKEAADKASKKNNTEDGDEDSKAPKKDDTEATDDTTTPKKDDTEATDDTEKPETTTDPKIKELEDDIAAKEKELADAEKSPDKNKEGIDVLKGAIAGMKKNLAAKKQKATTSESLVNRANAVGLNELATEIASKLDWQLDEGTFLYQKYDEVIKKAEYSNSLNESRYQNLSIKDRFSRLL